MSEITMFGHACVLVDDSWELAPSEFALALKAADVEILRFPNGDTWVHSPASNCFLIKYWNGEYAQAEFIPRVGEGKAVPLRVVYHEDPDTGKKHARVDLSYPYEAIKLNLGAVITPAYSNADELRFAAGISTEAAELERHALMVQQLEATIAELRAENASPRQPSGG